MVTTAVMVTVRVKHRTGRPHAVWVEPVGWEPDVSGFGKEATWDGSVYGTEAEGELAGMAAPATGLAREDDVCEVPVTDLFWLTTGDCRHAGRVGVSQATHPR